MKTVVAGVDIGGSHITAALTDLVTRKVLEGTEHRTIIDAGTDRSTIIAEWSAVIRRCFLEAGMHPSHIGIAMPGPFDYEKGISLMKDQGKYASLYGHNIRLLLAEAVGVDPGHIRFTNDAACFLQGERFGGAAQDHRQVVGITLGTGLGSACAVGDQVWDADLWHQPFRGKIAEESFSHRGLLRRYQELGGEVVDNVKDLSALADTDHRAQQCFTELGSGLGQFLAPVIREADAGLLVIGGNIARAFERFAPSLNDELAAQELGTELRKTWLGENATLVGAASLWSPQPVLS